MEFAVVVCSVRFIIDCRKYSRFSLHACVSFRFRLFHKLMNKISIGNDANIERTFAEREREMAIKLIEEKIATLETFYNLVFAIFNLFSSHQHSIDMRHRQFSEYYFTSFALIFVFSIE